jgi:hypothetical protein
MGLALCGRHGTGWSCRTRPRRQLRDVRRNPPCPPLVQEVPVSALDHFERIDQNSPGLQMYVQGHLDPSDTGL